MAKGIPEEDGPAAPHPEENPLPKQTIPLPKRLPANIPPKAAVGPPGRGKIPRQSFIPFRNRL